MIGYRDEVLRNRILFGTRQYFSLNYPHVIYMLIFVKEYFFPVWSTVKGPTLCKKRCLTILRVSLSSQ